MKKLYVFIVGCLAVANCYAVVIHTDTVNYGSCQKVTSGSPCFFGLYSFWIKSVSFGTLNFTGGTCSGDGTDDGYYDLYDIASGTVMPDSTYIFTVQRSGSSGGGFFSAWVDWNNDGDFADAGELLFTVSGSVGGTTRTFS